VREGLLKKAESILEAWIRARGEAPTMETVEGFRLLALHRQGCKGVPSFNACRETCREVAFHFNVLALPGDEKTRRRQLEMMERLVTHLELFVMGKIVLLLLPAVENRGKHPCLACAAATFRTSSCTTSRTTSGTRSSPTAT
jgi:hypothetical protein